MNSAVKNFELFFNSLKLTIKNFRPLTKNSKFFTAEFIEKNFKNFLQSISLNKKFDIFLENSKKHFCHKKKGVTGGGGG